MTAVRKAKRRKLTDRDDSSDRSYLLVHISVTELFVDVDASSNGERRY